MKIPFLMLAALFFSATSPAGAQILWHDITPDTTCGPGHPTSSFTVEIPGQILLHCNAIAVVAETHGPEILKRNGVPAKLNPGETITPSAAWDNGGTLVSTFPSDPANWRTDAADKYLGFRFKETFSSPDWHYGWIKLSVAEDASSFTIKEWAYNQQPNQPVKAGEKSNTTAIGGITKEAEIGLQLQGRKARISSRQQGLHYTVCITDMQGRSFNGITLTKTGEVDLSGLTPGLYILTVQSGDLHKAFKISVQ